VPGPFGRTFRISGNTFVDNWSGVVAWENADRFAGSPANTSTGDTTLVNPRVATVSACSDPGRIGRRPYVDDCRWKTQHVTVSHNSFVMHPAVLGGDCTARNGCGYVGVYSQWGSYPDWSPYKGRMVEDDITFRQHNVFQRNTYRGPWRFMVHELGHAVSWSSWRKAPYRQDAGSVRR
jgi:hypothetical protein